MKSVSDYCLSIRAAVAALLLLADPPTAAPTEAWKNVAIGGGGYVTGIAVHPREADLIYIRTDVGGAYRWNPASGKWAPLLDWIDPTNSKLIGVDGIAVDPSDANVVYAALGRDLVSYGGVFKSTDRGAHWTKVLSAAFDANGRAFRWCGECLAVDPLSSSTVYCGTRRQGLFRSTDGGTTWVHAADVPAGYTNANPSGIRAVAIDSSSSAGGRSQRVYATIPGTGIYRSQDGGATFAAMSGAPVNPHRIHAAPGGVLVVTHATGVALFDGSAWRTITPSDALNQPFAAVTVDPMNANRMVVSKYATAFGNALYRSSDAGATWQKLGTTGATITKHIEVPWWPAEYFSSATASLAADPHHPGRVLFTDWFGVWNTPDVWASATHWYTMENGHEETVVIELAAPPAGPPLVSCMADVSAFSHTNLDAYPGARLPTGNEGVDVDFCESQPRFLAMLGATSWEGSNTKLITSSNSAADWTVRTLSSGSTLGKLAYSAGDPARLVYCPGGGVPSYSANGGASWTVSQGAPTGAVGLTDIWNRDNALAADRGDGNRFYLYQAGKMYVSTDGGAVWALTNSSLPAKGGYYLRVTSAPGRTGEVWVSLDANGLWRSSDGGRTFAKIAWFERSRLLTFGCAASVTNAASAYVYGVHGGEWGLYRSTDLGATWTRVNNPQGAENACQFAGAACALAADRRVFGRVYVGTGGRGIFYGDTAAPASPIQLTATAAATNRIDLTWGDNANNETGYVIQRSPDSNTWGLVTLAAVNATNYSDAGLATSTLYHYRVAATNAGGLSACAYASARTWTAYESWQHAYFTPAQLTNSAVSGDAADPDHDGMNNANEFAAGTNPTNSASLLTMYAATNSPVADGAFRVCWQSVSGKTYTVKATTNLLRAFGDLATNLTATPTVNVYTDTVNGVVVKFYRVSVE